MNTVFKRCRANIFAIQIQKSGNRKLDNMYNYPRHNSYSVRKSDFETLSMNFIEPSRLLISSYRFLSISKNRCWKCNAVVTERDLVCMSCGCVQEPKHSLNYFEIFKETPHFDIDTRNLTVKFRRLQTLLHPDKIASRSEQEKDFSAEQSSLVNKAYQMLLRPIDRGLYLLELHNNPISEEDKQLPADFLIDIMELNESVEECRIPQKLEDIRHVNEAKLQMLYSEVSLAFKEKNITKAKESLSKLKYFINIDDKIRKREEDLGISRDD